jgi:hypothetical protein
VAVGDLIHDDNTGHGGSVAFRQQRDRAAQMMTSWKEGAGIAEPPPTTPRTERSAALRNLRGGPSPYSPEYEYEGKQEWLDRNRKHIETYGSNPT